MHGSLDCFLIIHKTCCVSTLMQIIQTELGVWTGITAWHDTDGLLGMTILSSNTAIYIYI